MNPRTAYPVAVLNFIFDEQERFLLFSRDGKRRWRVMGGQLEENETIPQCIQREIEEELGAIGYRFLDVLDAHVFDYDGGFRIISIFCLLRYESGEIIPSSDMAGYTYRWFRSDELRQADIACPHQFELVEKALFSVRRFRESESASFLKFRWRSLS